MVLLKKLNKLISSEELDVESFEFYISLLLERYSAVIQIIDFKLFDENKLVLSQQEKKKGLDLKNFEYAAKYWEIEKKCLFCIDLKSILKINESIFLCALDTCSESNNNLNQIIYYCYFQSTSVENIYKEILETLINSSKEYKI